MAMSTGGSGDGTMSEINVTPLVDVMLVLLIIFMITAPLLTHKIKVHVPVANPQVKNPKHAKPIDLAIKADGSMYWNNQQADEALVIARLKVEAGKNPQPVLQIRADKTLRVGTIKRVLKDAKDAGMVHTAFVTTGKN